MTVDELVRDLRHVTARVVSAAEHDFPEWDHYVDWSKDPDRTAEPYVNEDDGQPRPVVEDVPVTVWTR